MNSIAVFFCQIIIVCECHALSAYSVPPAEHFPVSSCTRTASFPLFTGLPSPASYEPFYQLAYPRPFT